MLLSYLILIGGSVQIALGYSHDAQAVLAVGAVWLAIGAVLFVLARKRQTPAISRTDIANPASRARALQQSGRGTLVRGLVVLGCSAAAGAVGMMRVWDLLVPDAAAIVPIILGGLLGVMALLGLVMYVASGTERSAIIPATVVIVDYADRHVRAVGGQPYVRFVLDVYPHGMSKYRAEIQKSVPIMAVPSLTVGARFTAQVAGPDNPDAIIIDFSTATSPAPDSLAEVPAPAGSASRLRELDSLRKQGLVTDDEYQSQRIRILDAL